MVTRILPRTGDRYQQAFSLRVHLLAERVQKRVFADPASAIALRYGTRASYWLNSPLRASDVANESTMLLAVPSGPAGVPETGGSLMLLGLTLVGLGTIARIRKGVG